MSNILTDNTRTRRLAASVLAGVVLLGGMAGLSGTAMAAGAGTITLAGWPFARRLARIPRRAAHSTGTTGESRPKTKENQ